jgi:hypothetical protein
LSWARGITRREERVEGNKRGQRKVEGSEESGGEREERKKKRVSV